MLILGTGSGETFFIFNGSRNKKEGKRTNSYCEEKSKNERNLPFALSAVTNI